MCCGNPIHIMMCGNVRQASSIPLGLPSFSFGLMWNRAEPIPANTPRAALLTRNAPLTHHRALLLLTAAIGPDSDQSLLSLTRSPLPAYSCSSTGLRFRRATIQEATSPASTTASGLHLTEETSQASDQGPHADAHLSVDNVHVPLR